MVLRISARNNKCNLAERIINEVLQPMFSYFPKIQILWLSEIVQRALENQEILSQK